MNLTAILWVVLAIAACAAVLLAGVPRRKGAPSLSAVAKRDERLVQLVGGIAATLLAALVLGAFDGTGAWLLLALVSAVAMPAAIDRWRRTNGDLAPLPALRARLEQASAAATTGGAKALRRQLANVPDALRASLAAAADSRRLELICTRLAEDALRTGRDGMPVWLDTGAAAAAERDALIALASAHANTREKALVTTP